MTNTYRWHQDDLAALNDNSFIASSPSSLTPRQLTVGEQPGDLWGVKWFWWNNFGWNNFCWLLDCVVTAVFSQVWSELEWSSVNITSQSQMSGVSSGHTVEQRSALRLWSELGHSVPWSPLETHGTCPHSHTLHWPLSFRQFAKILPTNVSKYSQQTLQHWLSTMLSAAHT